VAKVANLENIDYNYSMSKKNITITLKQLNEWGSTDPGLSIGKRSVDDYITLMEQYTPTKVFELARPAVIEEGISARDVTFTIVDESTGKEYSFTPPVDVVLG
jgi:hypothetical protein